MDSYLFRVLARHVCHEFIANFRCETAALDIELIQNRKYRQIDYLNDYYVMPRISLAQFLLSSMYLRTKQAFSVRIFSIIEA